MQRDPEALQAHLDKWRGRPLDYNAMDCARFAADWAGVELKAWHSERSALKAVKAYGARRVADAVDTVLTPRIMAGLARWGDIVALDTYPLDTLGICEGARCIFLDGKGGYIRKPLRECFRAWEVE